MANVIRIENISSKPRKSNGVVHPPEVKTGQHVEVTPGVSIRLFGHNPNHISGGLDYDVTYRIGDEAEYDSFNLSYHGRITKISAKCVYIWNDMYNKESRLDLYKFSWRNHNWNLAKAVKETLEWMD